MQDRDYQWQDHVPPSVGMMPTLLFAAAFLVAILVIGGYAHAQRDAEQRERIVQSIEESGPAGHVDQSGTLLAGGAKQTLSGGHLQLACGPQTPKS